MSNSFTHQSNASLLNIFMGSKQLFFTCALFVLVCPGVMAQEPIKVDVIYPQPLENNQTIVLTGSVEAKQHARLAPLESGRVATLEVEVGDQVAQGQLLLTMDSKLVALEVQGAAAAVKAAEVDHLESQRLYQEAQKLSAKNMVAKTLIDERAATVASTQAQLATVKASLNLQQERLHRHRLVAPFDGVIAQRNIDVGEWLTPQSAVLTLVAQNDLRLVVAIPQQYFSQLSAHSNIKVKVTPDSVAAQSFDATLSRLVPVSDPINRTFMAQIDLPQVDLPLADFPRDMVLVTGMSARAEITLPDTEQSGIVLPRNAIKQHPDGGSSVFVVENNVAKRIVISYTQLADNKVSVMNQSADQAFIITAVELLKEGMPVTVNVVQSDTHPGKD